MFRVLIIEHTHRTQSIYIYRHHCHHYQLCASLLSPTVNASFNTASNPSKEFKVLKESSIAPKECSIPTEEECSIPKKPACNFSINVSTGHHTAMPGKDISSSFHRRRTTSISSFSSFSVELGLWFHTAISNFKFEAYCGKISRRKKIRNYFGQFYELRWLQWNGVLLSWSKGIFGV